LRGRVGLRRRGDGDGTGRHEAQRRQDRKSTGGESTALCHWTLLFVELIGDDQLDEDYWR
jgi:hypothetical protein